MKKGNKCAKDLDVTKLAVLVGKLGSEWSPKTKEPMIVYIAKGLIKKGYRNASSSKSHLRK